jgi:hypothetical protein
VFKGLAKKGTAFDVWWERDHTKRYPPVDKPEKVIGSSFNCIDAGYWYTTAFRHGTISAMDIDDITTVTKAINGG